MSNRYGGESTLRRRSPVSVLRIHTNREFHNYLIRDALEKYSRIRAEAGQPLGVVLAIGAAHNEARILSEYPFEQVILTGICDPDSETVALMQERPVLQYRVENGEQLDVGSASADLTFCKEAMHHFARPVSGLYEMLRITRSVAILIEPYDTSVGRLMERFGLSSIWESNQPNHGRTTNYVFRWSRRLLETLLASYYVDSGWKLRIEVGWMRWSLNGHSLAPIRALSVSLGWLVGLLPGNEGNYMTAVIEVGHDIPPPTRA